MPVYVIATDKPIAHTCFTIKFNKLQVDLFLRVQNQAEIKSTRKQTIIVMDTVYGISSARWFPFRPEYEFILSADTQVRAAIKASSRWTPEQM